MIYFFLFCIFLFNALYFDFCKKERYRKEAYYIELLLLIMLAGCRHLVGTDTIKYLQETGNNVAGRMPGYVRKLENVKNLLVD